MRFMKTKISVEAKAILDEIDQKGPIRASELIKNIKVSSKTIHKHLANLQNLKLVAKSGMVPEVYYSRYSQADHKITPRTKSDLVIESNYIYVSPTGDITRGLNGFKIWCDKNDFNFEKEKKQFVDTHGAMSKFKKNGLISAKKRILSQKYAIDIDRLYFGDFYTIGHYGKTKLGQLIYIAKTSQNRELTLEISNNIRPSINNLIEKYKIEYVGYIPPTVDRKIQIMDLIQINLNLKEKLVVINKLPRRTRIAQKTLRKLADRIENAKNTIIVKPTQIIDGNVLLIDDATGSGATLNEVSKKIRQFSKNKIKIIGYTVVGSYKGFDVISEL